MSDSAEQVTAVIAERVRALRERSGMTQADLAAAMGAHGVDWKRGTVVHLEKRAAEGRSSADGPGRDAVSVGELLALARVLGVAPVELAPEVGDAEDERTRKVGGLVLRLAAELAAEFRP